MPAFEKTGSISFDPKIDPTELLSHFGKCLQAIRVDDLWVSGQQLTFGGGAFRFPHHLEPNLLLRISRFDPSPLPRRRAAPTRR